MQESRKTIRICAIFGSPGEQSFSSGIHEAFLSALSPDIKITRYHTSHMNVHYCTGCLACKTTGVCVFNDDMTSLLSDIGESSLITFSFPLYFTSLPGPLKTVIDRMQCVWQANRLPSAVRREKPLSSIAFITAGSSYQDMFTPSIRVVSHTVKTLGGTFDKTNSVFCENTDSAESDIIYKKALERAASIPQILHIGV